MPLNQVRKLAAGLRLGRIPDQEPIAAPHRSHRYNSQARPTVAAVLCIKYQQHPTLPVPVRMQNALGSWLKQWRSTLKSIPDRRHGTGPVSFQDRAIAANQVKALRLRSRLRKFVTRQAPSILIKAVLATSLVK